MGVNRYEVEFYKDIKRIANALEKKVNGSTGIVCATCGNPAVGFTGRGTSICHHCREIKELKHEIWVLKNVVDN